jgi:hypothetical protein
VDPIALRSAQADQFVAVFADENRKWHVRHR